MPEDADLNPTSQDLGRSYAQLLQEHGEGAELTEAPMEVSEPPAPPAPPPPMRILEALLFVGGAPLTVNRAMEIIRGLTADQFAAHVDTLNQHYRRQGRPYAIVPQGEGYVLTLRPRYSDVVEKLYGGPRQARLSTAALDVLALVAYRQPVSKQEVDSLRGAESGSLLRQLIRRGLVMVVHRGTAGNQEVAYGTTPRFLEFFGLDSLEDLPRTQDLQQL